MRTPDSASANEARTPKTSDRASFCGIEILYLCEHNQSFSLGRASVQTVDLGDVNKAVEGFPFEVEPPRRQLLTKHDLPVHIADS